MDANKHIKCTCNGWRKAERVHLKKREKRLYYLFFSYLREERELPSVQNALFEYLLHHFNGSHQFVRLSLHCHNNLQNIGKDQSYFKSQEHINCSDNSFIIAHVKHISYLCNPTFILISITEDYYCFHF